MSRYIDYDAIDYRNDRLHDKPEEFLNGVIYMAQRIEEAPSIDIVRCKECKYWIDNCDEDDDLFRECRWRDEEMPDADDYCSYGERSK